MNTETPEKLFMDVMQVRFIHAVDTPTILQQRLLQSCIDGRIRVIKSEQGNLLGYLAWANVTRETMNMLIAIQQLPLYPYEWNDGKLMLIYDIFINRYWQAEAHREIRQYITRRRFYSYFNNGRITLLLRLPHAKRFRRIGYSAFNWIKQPN